MSTDLRAEHQAWLSRQLERKKVARPESPNPAVRAFGLDPEGRKCKGCAHLFARQYTVKRYYKCALRGTPTRGAATDHRLRWPACSKFQKGVDDYEREDISNSLQRRGAGQGRGLRAIAGAQRASEKNR